MYNDMLNTWIEFNYTGENESHHIPFLSVDIYSKVMYA